VDVERAAGQAVGSAAERTVGRVVRRTVGSAVGSGRPAAFTRRAALTGAALGIGSLALPSATAAASSPSSAPTSFSPSAFTYTNEVPIAAWIPFDSADPASYSAEDGAGVIARRIDRDRLQAFLTQAGTPTSTTAALGDAALGDPEVRGSLQGTGGTSSSWRMRNSSSSLALEVTPHLRFSLSVDGGTLTLATLVLHAVSNLAIGAGGGSGSAVNLAAYVTAPSVTGDGTQVTTLRRTAALPAGEPGDTGRHLVINLGLAGRSFSTGTITVRLYPYALAEAREVRFGRFTTDPEPLPLTAADAVDGEVVNRVLESETDWMAAFVGTYQGPPELEPPGDD
jgi:hypothetical protein